MPIYFTHLEHKCSLKCIILQTLLSLWLLCLSAPPWAPILNVRIALWRLVLPISKESFPGNVLQMQREVDSLCVREIGSEDVQWETKLFKRSGNNRRKSHELILLEQLAS